MDKIEVLCPKCGNPVVLTEYARYLSKDMRSFEHIYEGCCPKCIERVVEHKNLLGSREYRVSVKESYLLGCREYRVSIKESKESN